MPLLPTLALLALLLYAAYRVLHLRLRGHRTTGVVVAVRESHFDEGAPIQHPTVCFTTQDGTVVTAEGTFSVQEPGARFRVGQQVPVRYAARNPRFFTLGSTSLGGLVFLLAVAALICGVLYWRHLHP